MTSRDGKRRTQNIFANADINYAPLKIKLGLNVHNAKSTDHQTKQHLDYKEKVDLLSELTLPTHPKYPAIFEILTYLSNAELI
ncbi:hypothetical protein ACT691_02175 [Vibrio metschnikovii]